MYAKYNKALFTIFLIIGLGLSSSECTAQKNMKWKQLFNGKDLNDWQIKIRYHKLNDNFGDTFLVKDGNIQVRYDHYTQFDEQFGHLFYKEPFSSYLIG